ncbi:MAG: hypothetical protein GXX79_05960 [Actinomycetales bacterium]|nr:hypothetical protein [Actinomycetales bacterium]
MSQEPSFGPQDTGAMPAPAAAEKTASSRGLVTVLLLGGGVLLVAALGVAAILLLGGSGDDDAVSADAGTEARTSRTPTPTPTMTATPTPTPTIAELQINARNPFEPLTSSSTAGGGAAGDSGEGDESAGTGGSASGGSGAAGSGSAGSAGSGGSVVTVTNTVTVKGSTIVRTTTKTVDSRAVWLTLFSLEDSPSEKATFIVSGESSNDEGVSILRSPGDTFGKDPQRFEYVGIHEKLIDDERCVDVSYVEDEFTLCVGEQVRVH